MIKNKICVFGLGYVGLTLSISFANKGFRVYGIEINQSILKSLNNSKAHFFEPNLNNFIKKNIVEEKFFFHPNYNSLMNCNIFIITVGTPLDKNKSVNMKMINRVCKEIQNYISPNSLIILRSTVKVGTTRFIYKKLKNYLKFSPNIAFCPERTIEGDAMREINSLPQIIGGINLKSSDLARKLFSHLTNSTVIVSSPEVAEMIKLVDNTSRDIKFAISNEIAIACDNLGISASEVISMGCKDYHRTNLAFPGPVGGPCLEKDTYIYEQSFKDFTPNIAKTSRKVNEGIIEHALSFVLKKKKSIKSIGILGMAFKGEPPTDDLRGSQSLKLIERLFSYLPLINIKVYDSLARIEDIKIFSQKLNYCSSIEECCDKSDVVFIMNKNYQFTHLDLDLLIKLMPHKAIFYDFWAQLYKDFSERDFYYSFGSHKEIFKQ